jgi:hypothetical protein
LIEAIVGTITGRDLLLVSTLFGAPLFREEAYGSDKAAAETTVARTQRKEQQFIPSGIIAYFWPEIE